VAGLRDVIVHAYFRVNPQIVWDIITVELEPLYKTIALMRIDNG
jgi:uncharacterized protein with HEPN domain